MYQFLLIKEIVFNLIDKQNLSDITDKKNFHNFYD